MTFMGAMNDVTDDVIEYRVLCELGRWGLAKTITVEILVEIEV